MPHWTGSWAFWAGAASGLVALASAVSGLIAANRRAAQSAGETSDLIEGRVAPIVTIESPATNRECVQYQERVDASVPQTDLHSDDVPQGEELAEEVVDQRIVDRAVGVFLIESEAGKALVWPGLNDVSYAQGWTTRENDDETRTSSEKVLLGGATVRVSGRPGQYARMMADMEDEAEELPEDLLKALQTRADLPGLPCYWPRNGGLAVEEEGAILDEGDEPAGAGLHFVFAGAAGLLSAVLLGCAWRGLL